MVKITMKKKRTISVMHPQLVRFRNALREVISTAESVEMGSLLNEGKDLEPTESKSDLEQVKILSDKRDKLRTAWDKSICTCSLCGSRASNMTFNPYMEEWFCVKCYEKNQEFYKAEAKKGEIWYGEGFHKTPSTKWWP